MSDFKELPSGEVVLFYIGDKKITTAIASVYGYNPIEDSWDVGVYIQAKQSGEYNWTETVEIRHAENGDWVIQRDRHQTPAFADPRTQTAGQDRNV